jgi:hypothetical protein
MGEQEAIRGANGRFAKGNRPANMWQKGQSGNPKGRPRGDDRVMVPAILSEARRIVGLLLINHDKLKPEDRETVRRWAGILLCTTDAPPDLEVAVPMMREKLSEYQKAFSG